MKTKNIMVAIAALATGAAAGWFAGGLGESSFAKASTAAQALADKPEDKRDGRASVAAKPKRKAPMRSTADAEVRRRALEKRVRFLEDSIRIAKEKQSPKALDANAASNDEIVERLMKLPSEWEREKELERLGTKRLNTFTMSQLGKLCPQRYPAPDKDWKVRHARIVEKTAERLAILDSVDQSLMTEEEKALHCEFADAIVRQSELHVEKLSLEDDSFATRTLGEVMDNTGHRHANYESRKALLPKERKMLVSQAAKHFAVPDDAVADLMAAVDDVSDVSDPTFFSTRK